MYSQLNLMLVVLKYFNIISRVLALGMRTPADSHMQGDAKVESVGSKQTRVTSYATI